MASAIPITDRLHRAVSPDGTEIMGGVHGQGPPLVLCHAGLGDGDLDWADALPFLTERFTCYLPSTRSRGLSGEHPDLSPERLSEDVAAFVDSIGEPVGIAGASGGTLLALGAAARSPAVVAVAVYEPIVLEVLRADDAAVLTDAIAHMAAQAAEGALVEAARDWMPHFADETELAALAAAGYWETRARYVPVLLEELSQAAEAPAASPTAPDVLARIAAPVLVLQGGATTTPWFLDGVRHVAEHVPSAEVREIAGAGHSGVWVQPEAVARELIRFFEATALSTRS